MRLLALLLFLLPAGLLHAQSRNLDIYWVDVEGGAATLIVSPSGESLLVDTGHPGNGDRDAKRIHLAATQLAGLKRLDYLLTTHFHGDHVGGTPVLSQVLPIGRYLDHGDSVELDNPRAAELFKGYQQLAAGKRRILKPGDRIPVKGVDIRVVASHGEVLKAPINGGGPNAALCRDAPLKKPDPSDNARSAGFLLTFRKFRFLDLGDLTWNIEHQLACPQNLIGQVDVYQTTHHGLDQSGAPQLVWAVAPRVAIMNNGARKGGHVEVFQNLKKSPGLEDIWQGHRSLNAPELNSDERLIANLEPECEGHWIKLSVAPDGRYTVTNGRNNYSKTYAPK
jgi:competence protein ComEC